MAYSELIKKIEKTREYVRRFYVYGFWHREQFDIRSARSYDNERRRIESWMSDYVFSRREPQGKVVYLSVDGRKISHNPLYHIFKAKSFTANDIFIHFYLMDILAEGEPYSVRVISEKINCEYLVQMEKSYVLDESTLRKKLREYEKTGLIQHIKNGNQLLYKRTDIHISLEQWEEAITFFSEIAPVGVIGSFLLDKLKNIPEYFCYKHRFLMHALDSEIMSVLLEALTEKAEVSLKMRLPNQETSDFVVHPMKIYMSTQNGRQYLLAWDKNNQRPWFYRLDNMLGVKTEKNVPKENEEVYIERFEKIKDKVWGVSLGDYKTIEHLEMIIIAEENEYYIPQRLEREKRGGKVEKIGENQYRFSIDVYDARELLPWVRTFVGRITKFSCSNQEVTEKFNQELQRLLELYGGETDVV